MARIAGIDLPREKRIEIALTYIYGIGVPTAKRLLERSGVSADTRVKDLTEEQERKLREAIEKTKAPIDASWFSLDEGGQSGTWIVVISHKTWASFDDPAVKSPPEIVREAFGPNEGQAIVQQVENATGGFFTSEVVEFRPDLSYFPPK